jgi:hypothetical protein
MSSFGSWFRRSSYSCPTWEDDTSLPPVFTALGADVAILRCLISRSKRFSYPSSWATSSGSIIGSLEHECEYERKCEHKSRLDVTIDLMPDLTLDSTLDLSNCLLLCELYIHTWSKEYFDNEAIEHCASY